MTRSHLEILLVLLAPAFVAAAVTLNLYGLSAIHPALIARPLLVAMVFAVVLSGIVLAASRRPVLTVLLSSGAILFLFHHREPLLLLCGVSAAFLVLNLWRRMRGRSALTVQASTVTFPLVILLVLEGVRLMGAGLVTMEDFTTGPPQTTAIGSGAPSVYVLLLDGYPRGDTLAAMGLDNDRFLADLEQRGLVVDREAESDFGRTELTLASTMLRDDQRLHIQEPPELPSMVSHRLTTRRTHLVNTNVMDELRGLGYRLVYVPPPVLHVYWSGWDEERDTGHLTDFETQALQRTPLRTLLAEFVMDQQRARVESSLLQWTRTAGERQEIVFAHLMVPHTPFLWGPEEDELGPLPCWMAGECNMYHASVDELGLSNDEYETLLVPQVEAVNRRVLAAVDELRTADPDALIAVFSDHGTRYQLPVNDEWFKTLFAASPHITGPEGLFVSVVNRTGR